MKAIYQVLENEGHDVQILPFMIIAQMPRDACPTPVL